MREIQKRTNECIIPVVRAMDIKSNDIIISILGSGDLPLVFAGQGAMVITVDQKQKQIEFANSQINRIKKGDYKEFYEARKMGKDGYSCRRYYNSLNFFNKERLDVIRKNLHKLEIREEEILRTIRSEKNFNKVYLSNALNHNPLNRYIERELRIISNSLPLGGLVYLTENIGSSYLLGSGLELDIDLTSKTKDIRWNPAVLIKTS